MTLKSKLALFSLAAAMMRVTVKIYSGSNNRLIGEMEFNNHEELLECITAHISAGNIVVSGDSESTTIKNIDII